MIPIPLAIAGVSAGVQLGSQLIDRVFSKKEGSAVNFDSLLKGTNASSKLEEPLSVYLSKYGVTRLDHLEALREDLRRTLMETPSMKHFLSGIPQAASVELSLKPSGIYQVVTSEGKSMDLTGDMALLAQRIHQLGHWTTQIRQPA